MRVLFGVVALLLAVVIVGGVAKKQLQAVEVSAVPRLPAGAANDARAGRPGAAPDAAADIASATRDGPAATPAQQSRDLQQRVRDDTARALQQGAERNVEAER